VGKAKAKAEKILPRGFAKTKAWRWWRCGKSRMAFSAVECRSFLSTQRLSPDEMEPRTRHPNKLLFQTIPSAASRNARKCGNACSEEAPHPHHQLTGVPLPLNFKSTGLVFSSCSIAAAMRNGRGTAAQVRPYLGKGNCAIRKPNLYTPSA
jgi:hypothetical protein